MILWLAGTKVMLLYGLGEEGMEDEGDGFKARLSEVTFSLEKRLASSANVEFRGS